MLVFGTMAFVCVYVCVLMPSHICVWALSLYPLTFQCVSQPTFIPLRSTSPFSSSPPHLSAITPSIHVFRRTDIPCRFVVDCISPNGKCRWPCCAYRLSCFLFRVMMIKMNRVSDALKSNWITSHASICMLPHPCLPHLRLSHSTFPKLPFTPLGSTCSSPFNLSWGSF